MMTKLLLIHPFLWFLTLTVSAPTTFANPSSTSDDYGFITRQYALSCIQLNKDLNLASKQMLETEEVKAHITGKISYLEKEIQKRRQLIEKLDQNSTRENNGNYNNLVTQFEDLLLERQHNITFYDKENQMHIVQHASVVRLEKRFSSQCLSEIKITEELHKSVCESKKNRWCEFFTF
ncbi:hypothetical protein MNBD_GAMMA08-711 [hydrothermal vent metagenome]|uniref:Uncharacterized protein n=1 Tax=hydrothermal vent metagenome TaxID=652676 RepID=A0A3B0XV99_9ZZZZ